MLTNYIVNNTKKNTKKKSKYKRHSGHRLIPLKNPNLLIKNYQKRQIMNKRELEHRRRETIRHRTREREDRQEYSFMMCIF